MGKSSLTVAALLCEVLGHKYKREGWVNKYIFSQAKYTGEDKVEMVIRLCDRGYITDYEPLDDDVIAKDWVRYEE